MNKIIELNPEQVKELASFAFSKYEQFSKDAMTQKRRLIRLEAEEAADFWSGIVDALTD